MNRLYQGMPVGSIENGSICLEYLAEAGPRLVRLTLVGSDENLLAETPSARWETPYGPYSIWGGHRLWHSPEVFPRTYVPDNAGLRVEALPEGVRLSQPVEQPTGIRKEVEVHLAEKGCHLEIQHRLTNTGPWPVELAPWAITMLPLGGVAILPETSPAAGQASLLPDRRLVLWPYTDWKDPRLAFDNTALLLRGEPRLPAVKIGVLNRRGWVGYYNRGTLLVKRFHPQPSQPHPDFGCNAEAYCNDQFIELETLGPLVSLAPGETAEHAETWDIYTNLDFPPTLEGLGALIQDLSL